MAEQEKNLKDLSMEHWEVASTKTGPNLDHINTGSLQRIADSLHRIAEATTQMAACAESARRAMIAWRDTAQRLDCENQKLQRQLRRAKKAAC